MLENQKEELNTEKEELVEEQKDLDAKRDILRGAKAEKQQLVSNTRSSQAQYQRWLNELKTLEKQLNDEIFKLEEDLRKSLRPAALPAGEFMWPVRGSLITQGYGCLTSSFAARSYARCQTNSGKTGGFHNGVDMASPLGTPVLSAESGSVVAMSSSRYGYGTWVAVKHGNGLVSLYAHLSKITVSNGQFCGYG